MAMPEVKVAVSVTTSTAALVSELMVAVPSPTANVAPPTLSVVPPPIGTTILDPDRTTIALSVRSGEPGEDLTSVTRLWLLGV